MKLIILTNDNAYASILIYPLLKRHAKNVSAIFIQDGIINSKMSPVSLFRTVLKKSGWSYASFLATEMICYKLAIYIRRILHINKEDNDCFLDMPSRLGRRFNIPVYKLRGSIHNQFNLEKVQELSPEVIITIRYGEILKKSILSIPPKGIINFHPSLLPKYGGIGPVFQAMYNNEKEIGYTIHFLDEQIDTGKILKQGKITPRIDDSISRTLLRIHYEGAYGLLEGVHKIEVGEISSTFNNEEYSYFSWPNKEDVKKFLKSGKKLMKITDILAVLFYNPRRL